jgi:hypothetical protein
MRKILLTAGLLLTGCSAWNDDFEEPVTRALPHASMHKITTMADRGLLDEKEDDIYGSGNRKVFKDGEVSRSKEDARRMYLTTWEDSEGVLHSGHHLYIIAKPSEWVVK